MQAVTFAAYSRSTVTVVKIFPNRKNQYFLKSFESELNQPICYTQKIPKLNLVTSGPKYLDFDFYTSNFGVNFSNSTPRCWTEYVENHDISVQRRPKSLLVFFACSKMMVLTQISRVLQNSIFFDVKKFSQR